MSVKPAGCGDEGGERGFGADPSRVGPCGQRHCSGHGPMPLFSSNTGKAAGRPISRVHSVRENYSWVGIHESHFPTQRRGLVFVHSEPPVAAFEVLRSGRGYGSSAISSGLKMPPITYPGEWGKAVKTAGSGKD